MEDLLENTNLYARQKKSKHKPVTKKELFQFLAINILMGIKRSPAYIYYWSMDPKLNDPYISNIMPIHRFEFFLSNLHIDDNEK